MADVCFAALSFTNGSSSTNAFAFAQPKIGKTDTFCFLYICYKYKNGFYTCNSNRIRMNTCEEIFRENVNSFQQPLHLLHHHHYKCLQRHICHYFA